MSDNIPTPEFDAPQGDAVDGAPPAPRSARTKFIVGGVVAALVIAAGAGYAFVSNNPAIKLARALSSTASSSTIAISGHVTPELLLGAGMTDADVVDADLPGVHTVADVAAALDLFSLEFATADSAADVNEKNTSLAIQYDSATLLRISMIERTLYLQTELTKLTSQKYALVRQKDVDQALSMFDGAPAEYTDAIAALRAGQYLSLSFAKGTALGDVYDQSVLGPTSGTNTQGADRLTEALLNSLKDSVSVTQNGRDADGDIYDVTLDTAKFIDGFAPELHNSLASLESLGVKPQDITAEWKKAVGTKKLAMRMWLSGDIVNKMAVDLTTSVETSKTLPAWSAQLIIKFKPVDLAAPTDAVDITNLVLPLLGA